MSHRLLWRGSLIANDVKLHGAHNFNALFYCSILRAGVAFVAQDKLASTSPAVPTSQRPSLLRSISSSSTTHAHIQADDPFLAASASKDMDLCLSLEMMRHRDLHIQRTVDLKPPVESQSASKRKGLKHRIKSLKAGVLDQVDIDTTAEVHIRVYIDPRCSRTKTWFETQFCKENVRFVFDDLLMSS